MADPLNIEEANALAVTHPAFMHVSRQQWRDGWAEVVVDGVRRFRRYRVIRDLGDLGLIVRNPELVLLEERLSNGR